MDSTQSPPIQTPPVESSPTQQIPPQSPKSFLSNKLILVAVILLIVLLAGGGAYFVLNTKSKSQPVISKTTPTSIPASAPSLTPDPTANWKTYTDSQNGFSFKYPSSLYVKISNKFPNSIFVMQNNIDIEKASEGPVSDLTIHVEKGNNIPAAFDNVKQNLHNPLDQNLTIDGASGRGISGTMSGNLEGTFNSNVVILKDNKVITLNFYEYNDKFSKAIFNQILSTFKFTDTNQTTDTSIWKTYTNSTVGFSFRYPTDWKEVDVTDHSGDLYLPKNVQPSIDFIFLSKTFLNGHFPTYSGSSKPITVDGIAGWKYENESSGPPPLSYYVDLLYKGGILRFQADKGPNLDLGQTLNQILSTFKFIK